MVRSHQMSILRTDCIQIFTFMSSTSRTIAFRLFPRIRSTCENSESTVGAYICCIDERHSFAAATADAQFNDSSIESFDIQAEEAQQNETIDGQISHADRLRIFAVESGRQTKNYAMRRKTIQTFTTTHCKFFYLYIFRRRFIS